MIVELLRPAGPELGRRWLAALLMVPEEERAAVVAAVEAKLASTYDASKLARTMAVRFPPVQKDGYIEEVTREYEVKPDTSPAQRRRRAR